MGASIKTRRIKQPIIEHGPAVKEALQFTLPSVIMTVSSILVFGLLDGFTPEQTNHFLVILFLAMIPSLLGTSAFQIVIYRIIDENRQTWPRAARRSLLMGFAFSLLFSAALSAVGYIFRQFLGLSLADFLYFAVLLLLSSMVWTMMAAFWAARRVFYPVVVFTTGYLSVLAITYGAHSLDAGYTITGYTLGMALLLVIMLGAAIKAFGKDQAEGTLQGRLSPIYWIAHNISLVAFSTLYLLVIFLDKIIVWVYQGIVADTGLLITGAYTIGGFLGLIPLFSVVATLYFGAATRHIVEKRYEGSLSEIKERSALYLRMYWRSLYWVLAVWAALFLLVAVTVYFLLPDALIFRTTVTVSVGSLFLVLILHNSQFLTTFGRGRISAISMLIVVLFELATIPLVSLDVWYAAAGFLAGTVIGYLISQGYTWYLSKDFEFHIYRYAARFAGLAWK